MVNPKVQILETIRIRLLKPEILPFLRQDFLSKHPTSDCFSWWGISLVSPSIELPLNSSLPCFHIRVYASSSHHQMAVVGLPASNLSSLCTLRQISLLWKIERLGYPIQNLHRSSTAISECSRLVRSSQCSSTPPGHFQARHFQQRGGCG